MIDSKILAIRYSPQSDTLKSVFIEPQPNWPRITGKIDMASHPCGGNGTPKTWSQEEKILSEGAKAEKM